MGHHRARALFRRLSRRLALPSMLMGLVVFSFTLLFFGTAVYTATLPSLVQDAVDGDGAYAQIASGSLLEALVGSGGNQDASGATGDGSTSGAGRVTSSGRVLSGVSGITGGASSSEIAGEDAQNDSSTDSGASEGENTAPGDDAGERPDGGSSGNTPGGDEEEPSDPVQEQADYEYLLAEFQAIDGQGGYIDQINDCTAAVEQDALASTEIRSRHRYRTLALEAELTNRYTANMNYLAKVSKRYKDALVNLVAMYRCLAMYVSTLNEVWMSNLSFEDPSQHVDEFMKPLEDAKINGENAALAEFQSYYDRFVL